MVPASYLDAIEARPPAIRAGVRSFALSMTTEAITVSEIWHSRMNADPAHRWLRGVVLETCREVGRG